MQESSLPFRLHQQLRQLRRALRATGRTKNNDDRADHIKHDFYTIENDRTSHNHEANSSSTASNSH